tara:strand:+ start:1950 stop:2168 length:219 start_codon:yes stop_codon:yes gene_type:complete
MDDSKQKIDDLKKTIRVLTEEVLALKEENETLWCYLEDGKASKVSVGDILVELMESEFQDDWLKNIKPVGEA